jgi:hypothetical protein
MIHKQGDDQTTVPPSVHQTLNMHIPPKAFDPIVLIMPESKFNAYAITAISTLIKILPHPISAMDAIYRARCAENAGFISRSKVPVQLTSNSQNYQ